MIDLATEVEPFSLLDPSKEQFECPASPKTGAIRDASRAAAGVVVGGAEPRRGLHGRKFEDDQIRDEAGADLAVLHQGKRARW